MWVGCPVVSLTFGMMNGGLVPELACLRSTDGAHYVSQRLRRDTPECQIQRDLRLRAARAISAPECQPLGQARCLVCHPALPAVSMGRDGFVEGPPLPAWTSVLLLFTGPSFRPSCFSKKRKKNFRPSSSSPDNTTAPPL